MKILYIFNGNSRRLIRRYSGKTEIEIKQRIEERKLNRSNSRATNEKATSRDCKGFDPCNPYEWFFQCLWKCSEPDDALFMENEENRVAGLLVQVNERFIRCIKCKGIWNLSTSAPGADSSNESGFNSGVNKKIVRFREIKFYNRGEQLRVQARV